MPTSLPAGSLAITSSWDPSQAAAAAVTFAQQNMSNQPNTPNPSGQQQDIQTDEEPSVPHPVLIVSQNPYMMHPAVGNGAMGIPPMGYGFMAPGYGYVGQGLSQGMTQGQLQQVNASQRMSQGMSQQSYQGMAQG